MSETLFKDFTSLLEKKGMDILEYNPSTGHIRTRTGRRSMNTLWSFLQREIKANPIPNRELMLTLLVESDALKFIADYLDHLSGKIGKEVPGWVEELELNINIADQDKAFVTNKSDGSVSPYDYRVYLLHCGMPEREAMIKARRVYPKYAPRTEERFYRGEVPGFTGEFYIYNTYTPPAWKALPDLGNPLPALFKKLIDHLFPVEEDKEFVLYWIRQSLVHRAKTFLILCGNPGVGKNRLKLFLSAAHGPLNAVDGKKSTLTTQFNSQLSQGTLLWFDELSYTQEEENAMKEVPNESISIEQKGVDATRSTELFGSYVISNNKHRDNYLSMDARKFCPVILNTERLETSMTWQEIEEFSNKVSYYHKDFDARFVADICYWIINNCDSDKWPVDEYKSKMFHILTHSSMSMWQKKVISIINEMVPGGDEYVAEKASKGGYAMFTSSKVGVMDCRSLANVFESVNKYTGSKTVFPEFSTVHSFINVYRDLNGEKICEVEAIPDDLFGNFKIIRIANSPDPLNSL